VESYSAALVVEVAEAERHAGGVLDQVVGAFGAGVGEVEFEEAEDLGPPGLNGLGEGDQFADVVVAGAPGVEAGQPVGDVGADAAAGRAGQQGAEFFLADPGGEQLPGRFGVDEIVSHAGELPVGQALAAAEQPPAVGPCRVGLAGRGGRAGRG
jgi:hypothetical protein